MFAPSSNNLRAFKNINDTAPSSVRSRQNYMSQKLIFSESSATEHGVFLFAAEFHLILVELINMLMYVCVYACVFTYMNCVCICICICILFYPAPESSF